MKKLICCLLTIFIALSSFASCGQNSDTSASSTSSASSVNTEVSVTLKELSEPVDTLPTPARRYFDNVNYNTDDYSSTVVNTYFSSALKPAPVRLAWKYSDKNKVSSSTVLISTDKNFKNPITINIEGCTENAKVYNLFTGTKYFWKVKCTLKDGETTTSKISSFTTVDSVRIVNIDGVNNVRDMGAWKTADGKVIKQGVAYRCAEMDSKGYTKISNDGIRTATDVLGIKTDIDLRSLEEITNSGSELTTGPLGSSVKYVHVSSAQYVKYLGSFEADTAVIKQFANLDNYPILFHCVVGADRTGTLAFMIKALLGVSENDIIMDYELTGTRNRSQPAFAAFIEAFKKLDGDTFQQKAYNFYHDKCGLTDMELSNILNIFLTDSAVFSSDSLDGPIERNGSKFSFNLDLRKSKGVKSVTLDGSNVEFSASGNSLTVKSGSNSGSHKGVITFNDGNSLSFELK